MWVFRRFSPSVFFKPLFFDKIDLMWFWLVLISGFSSSLQHIINRFILKEEKDVLIYTLLFQLTVALAVLPILVFDFRLPPFGLPYLMISISSILSGIYMFLTLKAYNFTDVSITIVVSQTRIIWVWLLGIMLLREGAGLMKSLGVMFIFGGVILVAIKGELKFNRGIWLVLAAAIIASLERVFDKYSLRFFPVPMLVFITSLVPVLVILPVIKTPKVRLKRFFEKKRKNVFLAGFLAAISYYSMIWAISLGEISRIIPIREAFVIVTIGGGIIFLKEKTKVWERVIGGLLVILGVIFVMLG